MKPFLKSLAAAAMSGAAAAAAAASTAGQANMKQIGATAGAGALAGVLAYLAKSPLTK